MDKSVSIDKIGRRHPKIIFFIFTLLFIFSAQAQTKQKTTSNFAGSLFTFDFANLSNVAGFEYERILYCKRKISLGVRGNYFLKYKSQNSFLADLNIGGSTYGYSDAYKISLVQVWGTGYFFTSKRKLNSGYFLCAGAGLTHSSAVKFKQISMGDKRYLSLLPGFEIGTGVKFSVSENNEMRMMLTTSFFSGQETPYSLERTALILLAFKISWGF